MRHILIDTSTDLADEIALVMALREPGIQVTAVTTLTGSVPIQKAIQNSFLGINAAENYAPIVYAGACKPMFHKITYPSTFDNQVSIEEPGTIEKIHAADAIIRTVSEYRDNVEFLTLGPLTNLALAIIKAPEIMKWLKRITLLGGSAIEGNVNPMAEFNIWFDAEAADIVFDFCVPIVMVASEALRPDCGLLQEDLDELAKNDSKYTKFFLDCSKAILKRDQIEDVFHPIILPAAIAFTVLVKPQLILESFSSYTRIETMGSEQVYGAAINDKRTAETHPFRARNYEILPDFNCQVVTKIDGKAFKAYLFDLLA